MGTMRAVRGRGKMTPRLLAGALATGAVALSACSLGGDDGNGTTGGTTAAADPAEFPAPKGRTMSELTADTEPATDTVISPAGLVVEKGTSRLGLGVFTLAREAIDDAEVALYAAQGSNGVVRGPFPARIESLETDSAYASQTSSTDPDAARVVYVSELELDSDGEWEVLAVIREEDGTLRAARLNSTLVAGQFPEVPSVGDKAPKIDTPTVDDVGGDLTKIDTRQPPGTMHEENFADVVGKKPVVLLFATPALCQSRVCGPVVDVAVQVKEETEEDVAFIHMEIFKGNQFDQGPRPQVEAFNLPTEPWLFVVDENGTISTAIEGAFSANELRAAIDKVTS
jgi:hypothetical protein